MPIMNIGLKIIRSNNVFEFFGNIISSDNHNKTGLLYYNMFESLVIYIVIPANAVCNSQDSKWLYVSSYLYMEL